VNQSI
jgi:RNase H-like domain found in reverse transcriptase